MLKLIGGILVAGSGVGLAVNPSSSHKYFGRGSTCITSDGAYFESTDADERCGVAKSMRTDC